MREVSHRTGSCLEDEGLLPAVAVSHPAVIVRRILDVSQKPLIISTTE
jgi:hypothetical protein